MKNNHAISATLGALFASVLSAAALVANAATITIREDGSVEKDFSRPPCQVILDRLPPLTDANVDDYRVTGRCSAGNTFVALRDPAVKDGASVGFLNLRCEAGKVVSTPADRLAAVPVQSMKTLLATVNDGVGACDEKHTIDVRLTVLDNPALRPLGLPALPPLSDALSRALDRHIELLPIIEARVWRRLSDLYGRYALEDAAPEFREMARQAGAPKRLSDAELACVITQLERAPTAEIHKRALATRVEEKDLPLLAEIEAFVRSDDSVTLPFRQDQTRAQVKRYQAGAPAIQPPTEPPPKPGSEAYIRIGAENKARADARNKFPSAGPAGKLLSVLSSGNFSPAIARAPAYFLATATTQCKLPVGAL